MEQKASNHLVTTANATDEAISVIRELLEANYFQGIYNGDIKLLRDIFDERALLVGDVRNEPYEKSLDQYLQAVANRVPPRDTGDIFSSTILSVDAVNSIAIAKVHMKMYDFNYYDLLSFHKIDNKWRIVLKMLTHVDE